MDVRQGFLLASKACEWPKLSAIQFVASMMSDCGVSQPAVFNNGVPSRHGFIVYVGSCDKTQRCRVYRNYMGFNRRVTNWRRRWQIGVATLTATQRITLGEVMAGNAWRKPRAQMPRLRTSLQRPAEHVLRAAARPRNMHMNKHPDQQTFI